MLNPFTFDYAHATQQLHDARDFAAEIIATASILANFRPKADGRTAKVYAAVVSFLALNWRNHLRGGK